MSYVRKTVDVWYFYVNYGYGDGWEHENTELTREAMKENRKAYRENCAYPLKIKLVRVPATPDMVEAIALEKQKYAVKAVAVAA